MNHREAVLAPVKTDRMNFRYDGYGYEPTPASAAAVQIFKSR
jgi:hypothetical protein